MTLDHSMVEEAMDLAFDDAMAQVEALADMYAPDGVAYDQDSLRGDAEVIAYVLDLQHRPSPEFNIWQFLPDVSPKVFDDLNRRYQKAMANQIAKRGTA